jgi:hypothetical protein
MRRKVFATLWTAALLEYDDLVALEWTWQSMDGAMTKSPLGGEKNRAEPDRPGEAGFQSERSGRGQGRADRRGGVRGEHPRHAAGRGDAFERAGGRRSPVSESPAGARLVGHLLWAWP